MLLRIVLIHETTVLYTLSKIPHKRPLFCLLARLNQDQCYYIIYQFPCGLTQKYFCRSHFQQHNSYQLSLFSADKCRDAGHTTATEELAPFYLRLRCSRAANAARACLSRVLKGLPELLSLSTLAYSLTNCDPAEWKCGERGNVNRVQLGFVPCLFPASRLCRNPHPHLTEMNDNLLSTVRNGQFEET